MSVNTQKSGKSEYQINDTFNGLYNSENAIKYYHSEKLTESTQSHVYSLFLFFRAEEVSIMPVLGGWNLDDVKGCNLPQKVQSAFTAVTSDQTGADYEPIAYLGSQAVNGTNYRVLAFQRFIVANSEKKIVKMIIHEGLDGSVRLV